MSPLRGWFVLCRASLSEARIDVLALVFFVAIVGCGTAAADQASEQKSSPAVEAGAAPAETAAVARRYALQQPVPDESQVAELLPLIREAYDNGGARRAGVAEDLISSILAAAEHTADPVKKYALLVVAEGVAFEQDAYVRAFQLLDERAAQFAIDLLTERLALLRRIAKSRSAPDANYFRITMATARMAPKHRHRYHGVFAPNHKLRKAVTALAIGNIGNIGKRSDAGHAGEAHATGCCDTQAKPRSHDTSRIAWAKLMARVGEEFPLECPACGGDIRLIAFITEPGPIRKILTHLGEPLEPPPVSPARGPPTDWGKLIQAHDDREAVQVSPDELPVIDSHSL